MQRTQRDTDSCRGHIETETAEPNRETDRDTDSRGHRETETAEPNRETDRDSCSGHRKTETADAAEDT